MELAAFFLAYAGAAALCLAMARHHQQAFGNAVTPARRRGFRLAGTALLAVALAAGVAAQGWAIGIVEWVGALGLGAIVVNVLHGFRPKWTPYAWPTATAGAAVLALLETLVVA